MGSFYELYYDQAVEYGPKLNLRIAKKGTLEEECGYVHMSGFPCYQLDRYLKILVTDLRKTVTIVEQFELPEAQRTGRQFERKVTRTVTPGTLITESFLDNQHSNYLLAVVFTNSHLEKQPTDDSPVALAWLDLSVGEFFYQSSSVKQIASDIARIQPKEVLLDSAIKRFGIEDGSWHPDLIELKRYHLSYHKFPGREFFDVYAPFANIKFEQFKADKSGHREMNAVVAVMAYVAENLPECEVQLKSPKEQHSNEIMKMDGRTIDALELFSSTTDSQRGSLFSTIRRTISPSGTRLLSSWMAAPLVSINTIEQRQDWVEYFMFHGSLCRQISEQLRLMDDVVRVMQRLSSLRRTDPADLVAVANAVRLMEKIIKLLEREQTSVTLPLVEALRENIKAPLKLAKKVEKCVDYEAVVTHDELEEDVEEEFVRKRRKKVHDGIDDTRIMRKDATLVLKRLYEEYENFDTHRHELWTRLMQRQKPGVQLNLKWSPMYSYHVHVSLSKKNMTFEDPSTVDVPGPILNQTKNRQCVQFPEWTELGTRRENMNERKREIELKLLQKLRKEALDSLPNIRACSDAVDIIDVIMSFAVLARENKLCRPKLTNQTKTSLDQARHLTVETGLKLRNAQFTPNDCNLDSSRQWVITGPNMGGKSTFIRQTALISILAQMGCFVPAQNATLGIVDQIFCRVGAADDLYRDRSTFMVEMLETSAILRSATPRSLAILDEVGRGTSSKDGLAIAFATIVHLAEENKCRTLFATHFGPELRQLLQTEGKDGLVEYHHAKWHVDGFHYKLEPGVCDNSHGLTVAKMAGFPDRALEIARNVL